MSARLVSALSGASRSRLSAWRRSGIVSATALPPKRGYPCAYRWDEYRRARIASLLLSHGLKAHRLRYVLNEYCRVIPPDNDLPTTVTEQQAIVRRPNGVGHTAERSPQDVVLDFVAQATIDKERINQHVADALPDGAAATAVYHEFATSWPLGQLHEYSDLIDVRPEVLGGSPTLKGRRLETAAISSMHDAGDSPMVIASAYDLRLETVERVIAFERELETYASAPG